jgi:hypothetical protein
VNLAVNTNPSSACHHVAFIGAGLLRPQLHCLSLNNSRWRIAVLYSLRLNLDDDLASGTEIKKR